MPASPTPIPAFHDNYIWALTEGNHCVVVDPGDAGPVRHFLRQHRLQLAAILITHHHPDHVGGIQALLNDNPVPVYGPAAEHIPGRTQALQDGDRLTPAGLSLSFEVIAVPGHTLGHIAYYSAQAGWLLCGDTLFAGGCGRLFEGTPEQMYQSLRRLAELPGDTRVFCAHEYTQANLTFAAQVTPEDPAVLARLEQVREQRGAGQITLPSRLDTELATNPFLRSGEPALREACEAHEPGGGSDAVRCFATLRRWKDNF